MLTTPLSAQPGAHPLRGVVRRHPLAAALVLFAAFEAVHVLLALDRGRLLGGLLGAGGDRGQGPAAWAIYTVLAILPVAVLGWWRETGFTRPGRRTAPPFLVPPLLAGMAFLGVGIHLDPADTVPLLVGTPLVALNEELFFRGLLLEILRPLGWRRAITWSAVLFGVAHAANLVSGGYLPFVALQVIATTAGGIAFAAIRIRSGSLWPLLALHVVLDVVALSTMTGAGVESPLLLPVVFAWGGANLLLWPYGWRLLRGRSEAELTSLYDGSAAADDTQRRRGNRQARPA